MTYSRIDFIRRRLEEARSYRKRLAVGERLSGFLFVAAALLLACSVPAGIWELPGAMRWPMLVLLVGVIVAGAAFQALTAIRERWNDEQMARSVEAHFPDLRNALISSVQLAAEKSPEAPDMIDRSIRDAARLSEPHDYRDAFPTHRVKRNAVAAASALFLLGLYGVAWPQRFQTALAQILHPGDFVPVHGLVRIEVKPGDSTVFHGEDLSVTSLLVTDGPVEENLGVQIATDMEVPETKAPEGPAAPAYPHRKSPHVMIRTGEGNFAYVFREVKRPFTYWVMAGRAQTRPYQVRVAYRPRVERIDLEYQYPAYTRLEPRLEENSDGAIKAVQGTRVHLKVTAGPPGKRLSAAQVALAPAATAPETTLSADNTAFDASLAVEKNGTYTIHLTDADDYSNQNPVSHPIVCVPDTVPRVAILQPGKNTTASPGETIRVTLEAKDDFGVVDLAILARVNETGAVSRVANWQSFPDPRIARVQFPWRLDPKSVKPGDVIDYHAEATDGNPAQSIGKSPRYSIRVIDPAQVQADAQKAVDEWDRQLREVLQDQRDARAAAAELAGTSPGASPADARDLPKRQASIRERTRTVAQTMSTSVGRTREVQKALLWLVANPMTDAVRLSEDAERPPLTGLPKRILPLLPVQDKIIAVLEQILGVLPRLADSPASPEPEETGGDLPDDTTEDRIDQLKENLKDLVDDQKKIIDTSADLAKRPVDDLTSEDDDKLRKMEAKEDRWSDFLKDTFSDFSKIPEQDFTNPSMLKEMIETQSEIEMAKDALAQKAVEIATPLEENGAELAEALTTHLEKWLPETPDREKWQMEEPLGEYETPMAELPKELEDIVGDLLEAEEDLFEEMEDTTSSWADSLDKGAGWDAMDGPISNMSAQGVTGNRLPNSSEIGGRSGEGRSGKSSGEFVEEEASGKGGRRTPTRLTPDPFESGQVKDSAPEAGGGSTGGGKESGAGQRGLEGPSPDSHPREVEALAQRQAELRNRAEKIKLQLQVTHYSTFFEETIKTMEDLEKDMRNNRYHDAFRRRQVLVGQLESARSFLQNEVRIHQDASHLLPSREQEMVLEALTGPIPRGFEDAVKKYYQAISKEP